MRNRSSISSFRWLRSGLLWTVLAVAAIEAGQGRFLPSRFFSHEVDEILFQIDTRHYQAEYLALGNSVGRQLASAIAGKDPGFFEPMASNASIETTGQYLLLRRYLERQPAPRGVVLFLDDPFNGNLTLVFVENYIQRCFLRWREIGELAWLRGSPVFTALMVGYKAMPTFRYRLHLQNRIPFLASDTVYLGMRPEELERAGGGVQESAFYRLWQRLTRKPGQSASAVSLERMLRLCEARGIDVYLVPTPIRQGEAARRAARPERRAITDRLAALQRAYPRLHYLPEPRVYPDDWFRDGVHFKQEYLADRAAEYHDLLKDWMDHGPP